MNKKEFAKNLALKVEIEELKEIAIYVRDNHLCGTPLLKAINNLVSTKEKYTKIKSI